MQLDVVTLFPEWFEWFRGVRHVRNALERGHEVRTLNPRDHSTLSGNVVDDTPFGGGAGMVLRVDVMDAALRGFYGVDPVELRTQRRVLALTPGGRMLDDRFVDELAAEPAITLLCGSSEGASWWSTTRSGRRWRRTSTSPRISRAARSSTASARWARS